MPDEPMTLGQIAERDGIKAALEAARQLGIDELEARFQIAIELGEIDGDVIIEDGLNDDQ